MSAYTTVWPSCSKCLKVHDPEYQCGTSPTPPHSPLPWKIRGDYLRVESVDGKTILDNGSACGEYSPIATEEDIELIVRCVNAFPNLVEAVTAVDIYFKVLHEQWNANDGRVVSEYGVVLNGSADANRLCNEASEKVQSALREVTKP